MPSAFAPLALNLIPDLPVVSPDHLLIVPVFEQEAPGELGAIDVASGGALTRARSTGELTGKPFELLVTPLQGKGSPARVAFVGAGNRAAWTTDRARRVATVAGLCARQRRAPGLVMLDRGPREGLLSRLQALAEGLCFANYEGGTYRTTDPPRFWLQSASIVSPDTGAAAVESVRRGRILGEHTNLARELANEPGNALTPAEFADRGSRVGYEAGLTVEVLDERRMTELGMGLLLGVARGSHESPRLLVLRHTPPTATGPVVGLIGKGITFDTGGISIKPAENMDKMKDDMAGGAAVIAAIAALARLQIPTPVVAVVPMTENMPGGRAIKPGDVLRSAEGKTVEVLNTDAEGRLILGDALWYARRLGATHLVDVATLTGACVVALGRSTSGLFGTPDWWRETVRAAGDRAGDRAWPLPLFEDYRDQFKSEIADMANTGGRYAGAITAALFLKEFAGDCPWVHLDIAGTAWAEEAKPYQPKGATGVAVRTLAELALDVERWRNLG